MSINDVYTPLTGQSEIRVIHLEPAQDTDAPFRCSFRVVDLNHTSMLQFEALSYTWGSAEIAGNVKCGNGTLGINGNLQAALMRLRSTNTTRSLWIDAICINQANTTEKSHQVSMMSLIYSRASKVVVWLGEDPSGPTGNTFTLLSLLHSIYSQHGISGITAPVQDPLALSRRDLATASVEEATALINMPEHRDKLVKFFTLPWFYRLWVVQEVALANHAIAILGDVELDFETILNTARFLGSGPGLYLGPAASAGIEQLRILQGACYLPREMLTLMDLVLMLRGKDCTDAKDRIYGLLGLCDHKTRKEIQIDYSRDTLSIYKDATRYMVDQNPSPYVVFATLETLPDTQRQLPSWMPDWNVQQSNLPLGHLDFYAADLTLPVSLTICEDLLLLEGKCMDKIELVQPEPEVVLPKAGGGSTSINDYWVAAFKQSYNCISSCLELAKTLRTPYLAGRSRRSCLPRMLSCGFNCRTFTKVSDEECEDNFATAMRFQTEMKNQLANGTQFADAAAAVKSDAQFTGELWEQFNQFEMQLGYLRNNGKRALARTSSGSLAWVPSTAQPGDVIFVLAGAKCPHVLRPDGENFKMLGECYQFGLMDDEASQKVEIPWQQIIVD